MLISACTWCHRSRTFSRCRFPAALEMLPLSPSLLPSCSKDDMTAPQLVSMSVPFARPPPLPSLLPLSAVGPAPAHALSLPLAELLLSVPADARPPLQSLPVLPALVLLPSLPPLPPSLPTLLMLLSQLPP